ncbi:MAG: MgtC/SapB family protein [Candidatus Syntrophonatronum acetioxidans]|uniref:MgtC/SapB family protein n=1 Tax=Candidatus Syntrophonatronum acetioxidans TaxID=1795816 RepID=A0A424YIF0_9FIRM|nr:MAG: MgtC/SapB family protein [Candidatus Syntrophonatronum acetioxidans]
MLSHGELILRLVLAALLGGLVGFERERHSRPAGFRTHILVCVGCSLVMLISTYAFSGELGEIGSGADPSRIASHAISGIGFLGAGTILRHGNTIRGLTTAASLWVVAVIGLAIGSGFYMGALVTTFILLTSLYTLKGVENYLAKKQRLRSLSIMAVDKPGLLGRIGAVFGRLGINITNVDMSDAEYLEAYQARVISLSFMLRVPPDFSPEELFQKVIQIDEVLEMTWDGEEVDKSIFPFFRQNKEHYMEMQDRDL